MKFYESAFGLEQVNRLEAPNPLEMMTNFGDTVDAAKANPGACIIVMRRASNDLDDPVAHLLRNVSDMNAATASVKAAAGSVQGTPIQFCKSGASSRSPPTPAGNQVEMIQLEKR